MNALKLTAAIAAVLAPLAALHAQNPTTQPKSTTRPQAPAVADEGNDPKAIAVIDKYLEAAGGKESLKQIRDRHSEFANKKFSPTGVTEMKMVRILKRPADPGAPVKIREEWELPGLGLADKLQFVQVYDGEQGWVKTMGFVSPLAGRTLTVFVWDKPIDDHFMSWEEDGYTVKHMGSDTVAGLPAEIVQTTSFAGRQKMKYFFDQQQGLLLKKEWTEAGVKGPVRKEVLFDEYIQIRFRDDPKKWVKFAINQKIFEDGELSLEKEFEKIVINGGVEDSVFGRPDGPAFEDRPQAKKKPETDPAEPASQPASKPGGSNVPAPKKGTTTAPKGKANDK